MKTRLLLSIVAIAALSVLLSKELGVAWPGSEWVFAQNWLLVIVAVILVGKQTFADAMPEAVALYRAKGERQLRLAAGQNAWMIAQRAGVPAEDLGVVVFLVRWSPARKLFGRVLVPMSSARLRSAGDTCDVTWTKGKGIVGRCWQLKKWQCEDMPAITKHLVSTETWEAAGQEKQMNMSFEEADAMQHFKTIGAYPINKDGKFVGCIAIDSLQRCKGKLEAKDIQEHILRPLAIAIANR